MKRKRSPSPSPSPDPYKPHADRLIDFIQGRTPANLSILSKRSTRSGLPNHPEDPFKVLQLATNEISKNYPGQFSILSTSEHFLELIS